MSRYIVLAAILCSFAALLSCTEGGSTGPDKSSDGTQLMGLANARTLEYLQTDTVTSFVPQYQVTVTSTNIKVHITGTDPDWVVSIGDRPAINIKVTDPYILQNGYWRPVGNTDTLIYFADPAIILKRSVQGSVSWKTYTPMYSNGLTESRLVLLNSYFGFYQSKAFVSKEQLLIPAGAFSASRFDVDLFVDRTDTLAVASAIEYYAPGVGLAKLVFEGQGLKRTLSLTKYY